MSSKTQVVPVHTEQHRILGVDHVVFSLDLKHCYIRAGEAMYIVIVRMGAGNPDGVAAI